MKKYSEEWFNLLIRLSKLRIHHDYWASSDEWDIWEMNYLDLCRKYKRFKSTEDLLIYLKILEKHKEIQFN